MAKFELHLGDCLEYMRGMPDGAVDAVVTDPPYGVNYQSAWRIDKSLRKDRIAGDDKPQVEWLQDAFCKVKDGGALLVFCEWTNAEIFRAAITQAGFALRSQVIWDRLAHGMADVRTLFAPQHDIIWFGTKGQGFNFRHGRPKSVIRAQRVSAEALVHPTEKPVQLMGQLVRAITTTGDTVFDPFMGSGTTGVACMQTGRKFIGCEIDEKYFAIAKKRIEDAAAQLHLFEETP